jgi:hypothetical protein
MKKKIPSTISDIRKKSWFPICSFGLVCPSISLPIFSSLRRLDEGWLFWTNMQNMIPSSISDTPDQNVQGVQFFPLV